MTTNPSPYVLTGPALVKLGYSAIPIMLGEKRPACGAGWQRYCVERPRDSEVDAWVRAGRFGVGVACGYNGLVAVDIDSNDPAFIAAIEALLPKLASGKKGRKGRTWFFRAAPTFPNVKLRLPNGDGVDLLARGAQTVLPPTIHKDTGKPYVWLTDDTLEHLAPEHLPLLADDVADRIEAALAPFGYEPEPVWAPASVDACNGDWRAVNDAALANLGAWVPALDMRAFRLSGGRWRGYATWRNGDDDNIGFAPNGIKDFTEQDGRSGKLTAVDVTMLARGLDKGQAKDWLEDRLGMKPEPVQINLKISPSKSDADIVSEKVVDSNTEQVTDPPRGVSLSGAVGLTGIKSIVAPRRIIVIDTAAAQDGKPPPRRMAKLINGNELRAMPKNKPWFFVEGAIPGRKVSLLMGEDGSGKSYLMLSLALAAATGGDWLGLKVMRGPVVFLTAEEEEEDVWERIAAIEDTLGRKLDLADFHLFTIDANDDSDDGYVLGSMDKGKIQMTALWRTLLRAVDVVRPVCLMLDPLVEIFDGDEMVRAQSRQFVSPIRNSARRSNLAVYLAGHPSKASVKDKTGTAGSTGWSATSRARQFYEIIYDGENNPTSDRKLHFKKLTGGKAGEIIEIKLNDRGVPVLADPTAAGSVEGGLDGVLAKMERDKQDFMGFIEKNCALGVFYTASPKSPKGYAPRAFITAAGGANRQKRVEAAAAVMDNLLAEKRITHKQYGPVSKDKWRLEVVSRTIPDFQESEGADDD